MTYELRPLSLAEILDASFRLVQTEWRTLVGLSLIMQIPIVLLTSQATWLYDPFAQPFADGEEPTPEMLIEIFGIVGVLFLAYLILYPFVAGAVTAAVGNFYLGRRFSISDAARAGAGALVKLVLAYIVYTVAIVIGFMLIAGIVALLGAAVVSALSALGTPGSVLGVVGGTLIFGVLFFWFFFLMMVSSLLAPVIILESKGLFASVRRAFELGSTAKWRLIATIFTAGLIVGIPVVGAQMMIGFIPVLGFAVWAAFQAVGFAFTTSVAVVLYFDMRCRAENYDLELLAEQVEAGPGLGQR